MLGSGHRVDELLRVSDGGEGVFRRSCRYLT